LRRRLAWVVQRNRESTVRILNVRTRNTRRAVLSAAAACNMVPRHIAVAVKVEGAG